MKVVQFRKVPMLGRFRLAAKSRRDIRGIRIRPDCVVGIKFNINAVHTDKKRAGELFNVSPQTRVIVR